MTRKPGWSIWKTALTGATNAEHHHETESQAEIEVDGGIKVSNAHLVVQAGASVIVAGSAIFSSGTRIAHNIAEIRKAVDM